MSSLVGNIGDDTPFWRSQYKYGDKSMPVLMYNENYTASQPQSDTVFAIGGDGVVSSVNISDGSLNWQNYTFDNFYNIWASSGGDVYSVGYSGFDGVAYSWNPEDGTVNWKNETSNIDDKPYNTIEHNGQIFAGTNDQMYVLDSTDGTVQWHSTNNDDYYDLCVSSEDVFVGAGDLVSLNRSDGTQNWRGSVNGPFVQTPLFINGTVYCGSENYIHGFADGSQIFETNIGSADFSPSLSYDSGVLYASYWTDSVFAFDINTETKIWSQSDYALDYPPAVDSNNVYAPTDSGLKCYDKSDGTEKWSYVTPSDIETIPVVTDSLAIVGTSDGTLYAVNKDTGNESWAFSENQDDIAGIDMENSTFSRSNREGITP